MSNTRQRIDYPNLLAFGTQLFQAVGLNEDKASTVATVLLEADLMGHSTHGLALVDWYLTAIQANQMTLEGDPEIISDFGATLAWNGRRLPGGWLTKRAFEQAAHRARRDGVGIVTIAESHHIGALAAYLPQITDEGLVGIVTCSNPSVAGVAPFGGTRKLFTPNPIAAGFPTDGDPIILDISASITTLSMAKELAASGKSFDHPWLLTADGHATTDPQAVISGEGSLLPMGGLEYGHKGFALALLIECLTQGLSGRSRADAPTGTCTSVFVQVMDPAAFSGLPAMLRQSTFIAEACRENPPRPDVQSVRVPGDKAMQLRRDALANGVPISPAILEMLNGHARRLGQSRLSQ